MAGKKTGPNPTDRGKRGVKRSVLTDGRGIPLSAVIDGANRHDSKLVESTLGAMVVERPVPTPEAPQHLCLDKGYDYEFVRQIVRHLHYTDHIRSRGEEASKARPVGYKPRRWVVERSHSWLNRFRGILTRWEKKARNYMAMLHLACALITFRAAQTFRLKALADAA